MLKQSWGVSLVRKHSLWQLWEMNDAYNTSNTDLDSGICISFCNVQIYICQDGLKPALPGGRSAWHVTAALEGTKFIYITCWSI